MSPAQRPAAGEALARQMLSAGGTATTAEIAAAAGLEAAEVESIRAQMVAVGAIRPPRPPANPAPLPAPPDPMVRMAGPVMTVPRDRPGAPAAAAGLPQVEALISALRVAAAGAPDGAAADIAGKALAQMEALAQRRRITDDIARLQAQLASARAELAALPSNGRTGSAAVRSWAAAAGVECPAYGRVPKAVVEAYRAAQGEAP